MPNLFRLGALALALPLAACASSGASQRPAVASTLELRALQTRGYSATSAKALMQALLDTMQDEGLRISRTEPELGLIVAEREQRIQTGLAKKFLRGYLTLATYGLASPFPDRRSILEATAQVSEGGGDVKVRLGLELRVLGRDGQLEQAQPVLEGAAYQAFFTRLDKSLYLRREGL